MLKNFNFKDDWKTSLTGLVAVIILVLNSLNIISPEQGEGIKEGVGSIVDAFGGGAFGVISAIVMALAAALQLFAKDPKKKDNS